MSSTYQSGFSSDPLTCTAPIEVGPLKHHSTSTGAEMAEIGDLTRAMKAGADPAFRAFYARYGIRLLRYLLVVSKGNAGIAEEALQKTLLRVAKNIRVFECEEVFWKWLCRLARTTCIDEFRRQRRRQNLLQRLWSERRPQTLNRREATVDPLMEALETGLAELPAGEASLLSDKYLERMSVAEIAFQAGLSPKAVESRLTRARRKLRTIIEKHLANEDQ